MTVAAILPCKRTCKPTRACGRAAACAPGTGASGLAAMRAPLADKTATRKLGTPTPSALPASACSPGELAESSSARLAHAPEAPARASCTPGSSGARGRGCAPASWQAWACAAEAAAALPPQACTAASPPASQARKGPAAPCSRTCAGRAASARQAGACGATDARRRSGAAECGRARRPGRSDCVRASRAAGAPSPAGAAHDAPGRNLPPSSSAPPASGSCSVGRASARSSAPCSSRAAERPDAAPALLLAGEASADTAGDCSASASLADPRAAPRGALPPPETRPPSASAPPPDAHPSLERHPSGRSPGGSQASQASGCPRPEAPAVLSSLAGGRRAGPSATPSHASAAAGQSTACAEEHARTDVASSRS